MQNQNPKPMKCPMCDSTEFDDEKGRLESNWGMTEHKVDMFICKQCKYVLLFGKGRTWWVRE